MKKYYIYLKKKYFFFCYLDTICIIFANIRILFRNTIKYNIHKSFTIRKHPRLSVRMYTPGNQYNTSIPHIVSRDFYWIHILFEMCSQLKSQQENVYSFYNTELRQCCRFHDKFYRCFCTIVHVIKTYFKCVQLNINNVKASTL